MMTMDKVLLRHVAQDVPLVMRRLGRHAAATAYLTAIARELSRHDPPEVVVELLRAFADGVEERAAIEEGQRDGTVDHDGRVRW
jgi:hypothetical protein